MQVIKCQGWRNWLCVNITCVKTVMVTLLLLKNRSHPRHTFVPQVQCSPLGTPSRWVSPEQSWALHAGGWAYSTVWAQIHNKIMAKSTLALSIFARQQLCTIGALIGCASVCVCFMYVWAGTFIVYSVCCACADHCTCITQSLTNNTNGTNV